MSDIHEFLQSFEYDYDAEVPAFEKIEVPQEISIGNKTYVLPPATSTLVPNPNIISNTPGTNPSYLVELGKHLLQSAESGDVESVKELLSKGAPMTADWLGTSPLHKAALRGHYGTAKTLLSAGCSRDARTKVEKTALHLAASGGHSSVVELLLTHHADPNCQDMLKMSPLHWAVESEDIESVEHLLRNGADATMENKFDKSPLEIASDKHCTDIYEMLLNADSYRTHPRLESEIATRTISNELNAHDGQYELTETITVAPEAAHTEVIEGGSKLLNNFGIKMLEEDDTKPLLTTPGQTLSLTEAGKRILSDSKTIQIKQEGGSSISPKVIRINGSSALPSATGQPRVIRLSSSQLNNLKMGNFNGSSFQGKKVMIMSNTGSKVTNTVPSTQAIKIVQVGNQHLQRKNIAIMPATSVISSSSSVTKVSAAVVEPGSRTDLKRRLADAEKEAEKLKVEHESKLAEIKRLKAQLDINDADQI